jgi:hypothetical protein
MAQGGRRNHLRHSGRTLYDHLVGTYRILKSEGASRDVCLAGLFHSIYGTSIYKADTMDANNPAHRDTIRKLIGERAEMPAWVFGQLDRPACWSKSDAEFPPDLAADLRAIEKANLREQSP